MPTFSLYTDDGRIYETTLPGQADEPTEAQWQAQWDKGEVRDLTGDFDASREYFRATGTMPRLPPDPTSAAIVGGIKSLGERILPGATAERPPMTMAQTGAEMGGGVVGGIAAQMLGRGSPAIGAVGTAAGTFAGGVATGRELTHSVMDAMEAAGMDWLTGGMARSFRSVLVPPLRPGSQAALQRFPERARSAGPLIERLQQVGPGQESQALGMTRAAAGRAVQEAWAKNEAVIGKAVRDTFEPIRQAIPSLDIEDIAGLAQQLGHPLPLVGSMLAEGVEKVGQVGAVYPGVQGAVSTSLLRPIQTVTFEDAIRMRSLLLAEKRMLDAGVPGTGSKIKAHTVGQIEQMLDERMAQAAESVGLEKPWRAANEFYRTEYADRFADKFVLDLVNKTSGDQLIKRMPRFTADEAEQFMRSLSALDKIVPKAMDVGRAGMVSALMESHMHPVTRVINPIGLAKDLQAMTEETRNLLLGKALANGLLDFAVKASKARSRIAIGVGTVGAVGTGVALGTLDPRAAMGALETINELNFLGRMIVDRPTIAKAITSALLRGDERALQKLTGLNTLRLVTSQAIPQAARAFGLNPSEQVGSYLKTLLQRDDVSLEQKIKEGQAAQGQ